MCKRINHVNRRRAATLATLALLICLACGPFFPNDIVSDPRTELLWAPVADFNRELQRIRPENAVKSPTAVTPAEQADVFDQSATVERAQLLVALRDAGVSSGRKNALLKEYEAVRSYIAKRQRERRWASVRGDLNDAQHEHPAPPHLPPDLPEDFREYLNGMLAYCAADYASAQRHWAPLAVDPKSGRRLWAMYMLGRTHLELREFDRAIEWFRQTRQLVHDGAKDPLGLANASLGWEAKAALEQGRFVDAFHLYFRQHQGHDPVAANSLLAVSRALYELPLEDLLPVARDPLASRLHTASMVARGGRHRPGPTQVAVKNWLRAVEKSDAGKVVGADQLAWTAYQAGEYADASRWIAFASSESALGNWIKSKLLLREGKLNEAAESLAKAAAAFPIDEKWHDVPGKYSFERYDGSALQPALRASAELGAVNLSRGQYVEALDLLLRAGWWRDAAYVAESVLTIDELKRYVDSNWPADKSSRKIVVPRTSGNDSEGWADLRHLLGRRLVREGRYDEAQPYLPADLRLTLIRYAKGLREGRDPARSKNERAQSLWGSAQDVRFSGMDLMGMELAPDGYETDGWFEGSAIANIRMEVEPADSLGAGAKERGRVQAHKTTPHKRFHYRYVAADLAWEAASLMDDDSEETAEVLFQAGMWLQRRDPKAAERFYHALIKRCLNTSRGRQVARLGWFPQK